MKTYTIQELSRMFSLPASTLRYYEEEGLLTHVGRDEAGQRVYQECHVNRLRTIYCFKRTGMTIARLKEFFQYEENEPEGVEHILRLLEAQQESVKKQEEQLKKDELHVRKKLLYYAAVREALQTGAPRPEWKDYRNLTPEELEKRQEKLQW